MPSKSIVLRRAEVNAQHFLMKRAKKSRINGMRLNIVGNFFVALPNGGAGSMSV